MQNSSESPNAHPPHPHPLQCGKFPENLRSKRVKNKQKSVDFAQTPLPPLVWKESTLFFEGFPNCLFPHVVKSLRYHGLPHKCQLSIALFQNVHLFCNHNARGKLKLLNFIKLDDHSNFYLSFCNTLMITNLKVKEYKLEIEIILSEQLFCI